MGRAKERKKWNDDAPTSMEKSGAEQRTLFAVGNGINHRLFRPRYGTAERQSAT